MIDNSVKTKKRGTQNLNPVDIDNVYLSIYLFIYRFIYRLTQEPSVAFSIIATDSVLDSYREIRTVLVTFQPAVNVG